MFESDPEIVQMGDTYISICCIFSFGLFVEISLEKILQATGNMIWPMIFQLVGAVSNIILDPILIFGMFGMPAMGVAGAAIATVGGQIIAMIFQHRGGGPSGEHAVRITFRGFRPHWRTVRDIYTVGLPAIVMQSIGTVMTMALSRILSAFSTTAYTVFGLYFKLVLRLYAGIRLAQGLMPIWATTTAHGTKRLLSALKQGCVIALIIMTLGLLVSCCSPPSCWGSSTPPGELFEIGVPALRIIASCFLFAALGICEFHLFQAVGRGVYSLIVSLMRQLVVLVPAAWVLARITGDKRRLVGLPPSRRSFPDRQHPVPAAALPKKSAFGNGERTLNVLPAACPLRTIAGRAFC